MEAFGYDKKDNEYNKIIKLSEVTLDCNKNDLDKIIEFLKSVRQDIAEKNVEDGSHWHYRDYNELWTEQESDLIIYLDNNTVE